MRCMAPLNLMQMQIDEPMVNLAVELARSVIFVVDKCDRLGCASMWNMSFGKPGIAYADDEAYEAQRRRNFIEKISDMLYTCLHFLRDRSHTVVSVWSRHHPKQQNLNIAGCGRMPPQLDKPVYQYEFFSFLTPVRQASNCSK